MTRLSPKVVMWVFGLTAIGALAVFLALFESSPGPLAAPHAQAAPGSFIWSCEKCHTDDGLEAGCLACHEEINQQFANNTGFHAYLRRRSPTACAQCHPDHNGRDFPLVSEVSWKGTDTNGFTHPHVEFTLTGGHQDLECSACHNERLHAPFTLAAFPSQTRPHTMLGLRQECIACHEDIHGGGDNTRDCSRCHDQEAFKPAPFFDHDQFYVLQGRHAKAACVACHQLDARPARVPVAPGPSFGPVKGRACSDCHESPHRFELARPRDCLACHQGADQSWSQGQRGVNATIHDRFFFKLEGAHAKVGCARCHPPELASYRERYPDPAAPGYARQAGQCQGCHQDPHGGQFKERHASCAGCHTVEAFMPSTLGPGGHSEFYPLLGAHLAVACSQCHKVDVASGTRQFTGTPTSCRVCHANPHGGQFEQEIRERDCTACHAKDFSTFRLREYQHQHMRAFFQGRGHVRATCIQCHRETKDEPGGPRYRDTPTACAACHVDTHRGQFRQNGQTRCERCHGAYDEWTADNFQHDRDSSFQLDKAHARVACDACHKPVRQPDNQRVVQYRPLTTKCEDCHGFKKK